MIKNIFESTPQARKQHTCDACQVVLDAIGARPFTISDYRLIVKAKRQGYTIQPGQRYVRQFNTDGSDKWTYRALPEMHELCRRFDLFPEWR